MERIEIRTQRRLYGVIVGGTALEFQHGRERFLVDLWATLAEGAPVIIERVCFPDEPCEVACVENPTEQ